MHKKTYRFVLTTLAPGLLALAAFSSTSKNDKSRAAIQKVLDDQQVAWNHGDVTQFLQGYWRSPELTFSGTGGITRGWDEVLSRYQKNYPNAAAMGELHFSDLEFRFLAGDSVLVLGKWRLAREKDEIGGVFTLVWQKFPEGWRIIHDHTSLSAAQP
jgi:ketosteroid isomerase-like protein